MKIVIMGIDRALTEKLDLQHLEKKEITIIYRGNKIDLEIRSEKLANKILQQVCGIDL